MPPIQFNHHKRGDQPPSNKRKRTTSPSHPIYVYSDSEEEERNIQNEIYILFDEFKRIEQQLSRTRERLKRLYSRREEIRIQRAVRQREIEIRKRMENQWLPSMKEVNENAARIQSNILNLISPPTHAQVEEANVLPITKEDKGTCTSLDHTLPECIKDILFSSFGVNDDEEDDEASSSPKN